MPADRGGQRIGRCMVGLALFGLGISMFLTAELGLPAWDVFHQGVSRKTGIPIGLVLEISSVFVLFLWIPLRQRLGLGTLLNALEIGLVVLAIGNHLPHADRIVWRLAYICGAMLSIAVGSGLYIGAGLGSGPRDGLMLGLSLRGISIRVARTIVELTVLAAGLALGGSIGIGTVVFTLGIGPLVQIFLPRLRLRGDLTQLASAH
ncbi:MAG: hypothetical protein HY826_04145 [Actinobacteria bacterium]|nr:hypothetical protein [Actinomycetota bacterium]